MIKEEDNECKELRDALNRFVKQNTDLNRDPNGNLARRMSSRANCESTQELLDEVSNCTREGCRRYCRANDGAGNLDEKTCLDACNTIERKYDPACVQLKEISCLGMCVDVDKRDLHECLRECKRINSLKPSM